MRTIGITFGQDIHMDLRKGPHRLCPFYERKWEQLYGCPGGTPSLVNMTFVNRPDADAAVLRLLELITRLTAG
ncbi:hypothetical protein [Streptomyces griseoluteus]|uniref:hypothetical protein n=1 Tax=Streptomyces griseoluteus TaxID=29306 RepID=UPI00382F74D8